MISFLGDWKLQYKFQPKHVFNVNETDISTDPNKLFKLIGLKEKKRVGNLSTDDSGTVFAMTQQDSMFLLCFDFFPRSREN
jgi:hypothetical protein